MRPGFVIFVVCCAAGSAMALPVGNPINATIPQSSWTVTVEDVLAIPNSFGSTEPRMEVMTSAPDGTGRLYVVDQRGKVWRFDPAAANPAATLFQLGDLSSAVPDFNSGFQTGVRGLAFHPDFDDNTKPGYRKVYTAHSRNGFAPLVGNPVIYPSPPGLNHDSVVGEFTVLANGTIDPNSYRELMRIGQPAADHNIGQITFNPNAGPGDDDYGNLYITLGDGGGPNDPNGLGQDLSAPHGSILRIDPLASGGDPYTIPDNPFVGQANTAEEIWAYGLRNPHRLTFDTGGDGAMLISDIGQANIEEVNLGAAGANYGWSQREGAFVFNNSGALDPLPAGHPTDPYTYPVVQYDHDPNNDNVVSGSWAVAGGPVARGPGVPQLNGMYLFGDFGTNSGPIFAVDMDHIQQREDFTNLSSLDDGTLAPVVELQLVHSGQAKSFLQIIRDELNNQGQSRTDLRFGFGDDGTVYLMNKHDGVLRRLSLVSGLADGDTDRDGDVDQFDLFRLAANFGAADQTWGHGDFNGDGLINTIDVGLLAGNWPGGPSSPQLVGLLDDLGLQVPEPAAGVCVLLGALAIGVRRARR